MVKKCIQICKEHDFEMTLMSKNWSFFQNCSPHFAFCFITPSISIIRHFRSLWKVENSNFSNLEADYCARIRREFKLTIRKEKKFVKIPPNDRFRFQVGFRENPEFLTPLLYAAVAARNWRLLQRLCSNRGFALRNPRRLSKSRLLDFSLPRLLIETVLSRTVEVVPCDFSVPHPPLHRREIKGKYVSLNHFRRGRGGGVSYFQRRRRLLYHAAAIRYFNYHSVSVRNSSGVNSFVSSMNSSRSSRSASIHYFH